MWEAHVNPQSVADALGSHTPQVRELLVDVIRTRHALAAESHLAAQTRFGHVFGSQWRDLLVDAHDALVAKGFESHTLRPAGYKVPVVKECVVYIWRDSEGGDSVAGFASSPTRKGGFDAHPPTQLPLPYDLASIDAHHTADGASSVAVEAVLEGVDGSMPLVLVRITSSPRQLQSVAWSVAVLDESGIVRLLGEEVIWMPESTASMDSTVVESFDSGEPVAPVVELVPQGGKRTDE